MRGHKEGLDELPPSCGWPCSIENTLFLKPKEILLGCLV